MERAVFIPSGATPPLDDVDRVYSGSEFCPWTFPGSAEIQRCLQLARNASLPVTITTPVFGEFFLDRLRRILSEIADQLRVGDEIVISDWGTLPLVQEILPQIEIVIGRALSGQKRGPQILDLNLTEEQLRYFQESRFYSQEARQLLAELGIRRVELDLPPQGVSRVPEPLRATLHLSYVMVTSSRNCPYRHGDGSKGCAGGCGEIFTLTSPQSALPLLQGGNTQFVAVSGLPADLAGLRIDRVVSHIVLPR